MRVLAFALLVAAAHAGGELVFRDGEHQATGIMNGKNLEFKGPSDGCVTIDGSCVKEMFTSLADVDDALAKGQTALQESLGKLTQLVDANTVALKGLTEALTKHKGDAATDKELEAVKIALEEAIETIELTPGPQGERGIDGAKGEKGDISGVNYHWSAADKVDGGWTAPEDQGWSECTHSLQHCKNGEGEQEQHLFCTNPRPKYGGAKCGAASYPTLAAADVAAGLGAEVSAGPGGVVVRACGLATPCTCNCANGTPVAGAACIKHGAAKCMSCNAGFWLSADACRAHNVCTATQHETAAPTGTSDRECTDNSQCHTAPTQYESKAPTATSDRECSSHDVCSDDQYEKEAATDHSPRICATKECTCHAGSPAIGTACPTHNTVYCISCHGGWKGSNCDQKKDCEASYCNNRGTVTGNQVDGCTCPSCNGGYMGDTCEEQIGSVSCTFTSDNYVRNVYVDGSNQNHRVSGNMHSWPSRKYLSFSSSARTIAIQADDAECGCHCGGFAIRCSQSGASGPGSQWTVHSGERGYWKVVGSGHWGGGPGSDSQGRSWYAKDYIEDGRWSTPSDAPGWAAAATIGVPDMCSYSGNKWWFRFKIRS